MSSAISGVLGFVLIGYLLSLVLFGILLAQTVTYFRNYKRDSRWMKLFVGALVTVNTTTSVSPATCMFQLLVDGHGDILVLTMVGRFLPSSCICFGLIGGMVQLFFAWRLNIIGSTHYPETSVSASRDYIIAKQPWVTVFIVIFSLFGTLSLGVGCGAAAAAWGNDISRLPTLRHLVTVWVMFTMVPDVFITAAMTYHLRRATGSFESTDRLLNRVVRSTIQNAALMTLTTSLSLFLYLYVIEPYYIAGTLLLPQLYSISALSSLNARKHLRSPVNASVTASERSLILELVDISPDEPAPRLKYSKSVKV